MGPTDGNRDNNRDNVKGERNWPAVRMGNAKFARLAKLSALHTIVTDGSALRIGESSFYLVRR